VIEPINKKSVFKTAKLYNYTLTGNWENDRATLIYKIADKHHFPYYSTTNSDLLFNSYIDENIGLTFGMISCGLSYKGYTSLKDCEIALLMNLSESSIRRHIKWLEENKYIVIIPKKLYKDPSTGETISEDRKLYLEYAFRLRYNKNHSNQEKNIQNKEEIARIQPWS
jgi:transcription initiation factor IIE alpha subunit